MGKTVFGGEDFGFSVALACMSYTVVFDSVTVRCFWSMFPGWGGFGCQLTPARPLRPFIPLLVEGRAKVLLGGGEEGP